MKDLIMAFVLRAEQCFILRAEIMTKIAEQLGLTYVACPGGAPETLNLLKAFPPIRQEVTKIVDTLSRHGGMKDSVDLVVASGLLVADTVFLGNDEAKARYYRQTALGHTFEDGFVGRAGEASFSSFEWVERVDDDPDLYHLCLVLNAPFSLQGVTQLRSRRTPWPEMQTDMDMAEVKTVSDAFNKQFRLRTSDQVEARAVFNPAVIERVLAFAEARRFRIVAFQDHIVFDVIGENRFNFLDLSTGEWSEASIQKALRDIAELHSFVDEASHALMVRN